jgi:hypothetical protein
MVCAEPAFVFAQVLTGPLRVINTLRDLRQRADHAAVIDPRFRRPGIREDHQPHAAAAKMSPREKVKFLKAAWDAIGSNSARAIPNTRCSTRGASSPPGTATGRLGRRDRHGGRPMSGYQLWTSSHIAVPCLASERPSITMGILPDRQ